VIELDAETSNTPPRSLYKVVRAEAYRKWREASPKDLLSETTFS
jgi:hypothetical protein